MEISGFNGPLGLNAYIKSATSNTPAGQANEGSVGNKTSVREDKVVLSQAATEIREAQKILKVLPDSDPGKLARIQRKIVSGNYQLDSQKIATNMIQESLLNRFI